MQRSFRISSGFILAAGLASAYLPCAKLNAQTKTPFAGLIAMGKIPAGPLSVPGTTFVNDLAEPNAHTNTYVGVDINVTWAQLQPTSSTALDTSAIDDALNTITTYNATHSPQLKAKLHVWAGVNTPDWELSKGSVSLETPAGTYEPYPKFWSPTYHTDWKNLQNLLAAVYDSNALIGEVTVGSCSTKTNEPFALVNDSTSFSNLTAAFYTDAKYLNCLTHAASDDYSAWTATPIDFPFNAFEHVDTGHLVNDTTTTLQLMQTFRSTFGARAIVSNHGLQDPLNAVIVPVYDGGSGYYGIKQLGRPVAFQTVSQNPAGGWDATMALGFNTYNASEIEIWVTTAAGGTANITPTQLSTWKAWAW